MLTVMVAVCLAGQAWTNSGWASNPLAANEVRIPIFVEITAADDVEYGADLADLFGLPEAEKPARPPEAQTPDPAVQDDMATEDVQPVPVQLPTDRGYDGQTYWLRDRHGQAWTSPVWSDLWAAVQRANEAQPAMQVQYAPTCQYQQGADGRIYQVCPR